MKTAVAAPPAATVPRLWPDSTIVILATGPSLTAEDVDACRGRARVIAVKNAFDLAPWADVVYCAGGDTTRWWHRHGDRVAQSDALRFALDPSCARWATVLQLGPELGLSTDPRRLALGRHSGYQAINLAVHLGAKKIVLLGYDMQPDPAKGNHFFGEHPTGNKPRYSDWLPHFTSLVDPLAQLGITILNATRSSAITCFPKVSLEDALR